MEYPHGDFILESNLLQSLQPEVPQKLETLEPLTHRFFPRISLVILKIKISNRPKHLSPDDIFTTLGYTEDCCANRKCNK